MYGVDTRTSSRTIPPNDENALSIGLGRYVLPHAPSPTGPRINLYTQKVRQAGREAGRRVSKHAGK